MDFVADNLFNGRRIRALTVVDNLSRECLAIHVDQGIKGRDVVQIMERLRLFVGAVLKEYNLTTGRSLSRKIWINGHMRTVSLLTSQDLENLLITP